MPPKHLKDNDEWLGTRGLVGSSHWGMIVMTQNRKEEGKQLIKRLFELRSSEDIHVTVSTEALSELIVRLQNAEEQLARLATRE